MEETSVVNVVANEHRVPRKSVRSTFVCDNVNDGASWEGREAVATGSFFLSLDGSKDVAGIYNTPAVTTDVG